MSYGIPTSLLLADDQNGGAVKNEYIQQSIEMLKKESAKYDGNGNSSSSASNETDKNDDGNIYEEIATSKDVLLGRGIPYQTHPGNLQLVRLVEEYKQQYINASKFQKTILTWAIVNKIWEVYDGRFLERYDDDRDNDHVDDNNNNNNNNSNNKKRRRRRAWKVCSNNAARSKVAVSFRSSIKMDKLRGDNCNNKNHHKQGQEPLSDHGISVSSSLTTQEGGGGHRRKNPPTNPEEDTTHQMTAAWTSNSSISHGAHDEKRQKIG